MLLSKSSIVALDAGRYTHFMGRVAVIENLPPYEKGRGQELADISAEAEDGAFEAVLYPNRSLPNTGFMLVMAVVIGANLIFGAYFYAIGAWPVIGFCGLDVFLVWLAFKISYRQGRLHERIRITNDDLWVSRVLPSGHETRWKLQPFWTRVVIDDPVRHESQLQLWSKGGALVIGSFLSPGERGELGAALQKALDKVRSR